MRISIITLITVFFLFWFSTVSLAADVAKIGVFDFGKILEISSAGKAAKLELTEQGQKMGDDLKKKGGELEELKKRLERESLVMDKEMRAEKEREFRIKVNDFKELQQRYSEQARQMQENVTRRMGKQVQELVEQIGKTEGYLIIIEKRKGGVWYHPTAIDLTDRLIKEFNEKYAKEVENKKE
jgi:outer membrane protein